MRNFVKNSLIVISLSVFLFSSNLSFAAALSNSKDYSRIFYYREGEMAHASLLKNSASIDILAPQTYAFTDDGSLKGDIDPEVLAFTKIKNIKVMPLVTNGSFDKNSLDQILNDAGKQNQAIQELIDEAKKYDFYGWQIDFEQMDETYKDKFSAFIKNFGQKLKNENLVSSVAVISKISDNEYDYKEGLYKKIIAVYDYEVLAKNVDFISLMSYDDPDSKGPIARYSWLKKVLDYSLKYIPPNKLSLGISLYYWRWDDQTGKKLGIGGYKQMKERMDKYNTKYGYDSFEEAPYLKYTYKNKQYTIWYENNRSLKNKINLISIYNLHGFSAWALGLEVPSSHLAFIK